MLSALSQAWASWKATPGVALLAVLAFAIGIGAAAAIVTVVNGVMLRPMPYRRASASWRCTARGRPNATLLALAAARTFWPGSDPVGASGRLSQADGPRFTVVGIVGDVRNVGSTRPTEPELYFAAPLSARLSAAMQHWIGDAEQYDDLTFVVMKVR